MSEFEARIDFTPALVAKLSRVGTLLTKRYGRRSTLEEVLDVSVEVFLNKMDPERRAQRLALKAAAKRIPREKKVVVEWGVASHLKIQALRRDRNQCCYRDGGLRCKARKRVDVVSIKRSGQPLVLRDVSTRCPRHRFQDLSSG